MMIFTTLGFLLMLNTNNFGFSIVNFDTNFEQLFEKTLTSELEEYIQPSEQPSEQPIYRSLPSGGKDGRKGGKGGKGGGKGGKGGKGGRKRGNNNVIETYEDNHEEEYIQPTYQPSEQPIYRSLPSGGKDGRKGGKGGKGGGKGGKGGRKRANNNVIETYEDNHENNFIKRLNDNNFLDEPIQTYIHDFNENPKHSSHIFIEEILKDKTNKTQDLLFFQLTTEVDYIFPDIIFMS
jgi:hypothetical protein